MSSLFSTCLTTSNSIGVVANVMSPPLIGGGITMMLSDVYLSDVCLSRTHRGVNASGNCSGERGNVLGVETYCYVAVCRRGGLGGARRLDAHRGRRGAGAYCGGRPPIACYFNNNLVYLRFPGHGVAIIVECVIVWLLLIG